MVHGPTCRKRVMVTEGQVLSSKSQARAGLSSAACRRSRAGAVLSRSPPPPPRTNQPGQDAQRRGLQSPLEERWDEPISAHFSDSQTCAQRIRREKMSPEEPASFTHSPWASLEWTFQSRIRTLLWRILSTFCGFP